MPVGLGDAPVTDLSPKCLIGPRSGALNRFFDKLFVRLPGDHVRFASSSSIPLHHATNLL